MHRNWNRNWNDLHTFCLLLLRVGLHILPQSKIMCEIQCKSIRLSTFSSFSVSVEEWTNFIISIYSVFSCDWFSYFKLKNQMKWRELMGHSLTAYELPLFLTTKSNYMLCILNAFDSHLKKLNTSSIWEQNCANNEKRKLQRIEQNASNEFCRTKSAAWIPYTYLYCILFIYKHRIKQNRKHNGVVLAMRTVSG